MIGLRVIAGVLRVAAMGLVLGGVVASSAAADGATRAIAVVYPDIGEPYRSVFTSIIDGIQAQTPGHVTALAVANGANPQDVVSELRRRDIRSVVALGRSGLRVAATLDRAINVVVGGVLSVPESAARDFAVHSLAPDPDLLFAQLKTLVPKARRVIVVYDPRQNDWLIRIARAAARSRGIELQAIEASDLKAAVRSYREALATADPRSDVVWLPQDSTTVDEAVVVPLVLEQAWGRNIVVFSSSLSHVRRGALFALYPDNHELGRDLAAYVLALGPAGAASAAFGVRPLTEVRLALNTRTADHLGLSVDRQAESVGMVFPEP